MNFDPKQVLLVALGAFTLFYLIAFARGMVLAKRQGTPDPQNVTGTALTVAFIANFFDTLGIGSFATTTAAFRQFKMVRDEIIPGTLNVGYVLPTIAQAFIFTTVIPVDSLTLILMILAAVVGAWLGAGIVAGWPRQRIQVGMGIALLVAAAIMLYRTAIGDPTGSDAIGLRGALLAAGLVGNFVLGALMTLGIGLYAPCMILVSMLGLNPGTAFPIMMGSCAFLMPVASAKFVEKRAFHPGVALSLAIGGIPAVLIASRLVQEMVNRYLWAVKYLVVVVVVYAAVGLLRTWRSERVPAGKQTVQAGAG